MSLVAPVFSVAPWLWDGSASDSFTLSYAYSDRYLPMLSLFSRRLLSCVFRLARSALSSGRRCFTLSGFFGGRLCYYCWGWVPLWLFPDSLAGPLVGGNAYGGKASGSGLISVKLRSPVSLLTSILKFLIVFLSPTSFVASLWVAIGTSSSVFLRFKSSQL